MKKENFVLAIAKEIKEDLTSSRYSLKEKICNAAVWTFGVSLMFIVITMIIIKIIYLLPVAVIGTFFTILAGASAIVVKITED